MTRFTVVCGGCASHSNTRHPRQKRILPQPASTLKRPSLVGFDHPKCWRIPENWQRHLHPDAISYHFACRTLCNLPSELALLPPHSISLGLHARLRCARIGAFQLFRLGSGRTPSCHILDVQILEMRCQPPLMHQPYGSTSNKCSKH